MSWMWWLRPFLVICVLLGSIHCASTTTRASVQPHVDIAVREVRATPTSLMLLLAVVNHGSASLVLLNDDPLERIQAFQADSARALVYQDDLTNTKREDLLALCWVSPRIVVPAGGAILLAIHLHAEQSPEDGYAIDVSALFADLACERIVVELRTQRLIARASFGTD